MIVPSGSCQRYCRHGIATTIFCISRKEARLCDVVVSVRRGTAVCIDAGRDQLVSRFRSVQLLSVWESPLALQFCQASNGSKAANEIPSQWPMFIPNGGAIGA